MCLLLVVLLHLHHVWVCTIGCCGEEEGREGEKEGKGEEEGKGVRNVGKGKRKWTKEGGWRWRKEGKRRGARASSLRVYGFPEFYEVTC